MINFKRNNNPRRPWELYELHIGEMPMNIFWPTEELYNFAIASEDLKISNGIDIEAEATSDVADKLVKVFDHSTATYADGTPHEFITPIFGGIFLPRTRLEIICALYGPIREWRAEREASHSA